MWANKYIGIPYVDQGFDFSGCHCYGLYWLVLKNECGIELNKYAPITASNLRAAVKAVRHEAQFGPWKPVTNSQPQDFDIVLIGAYEQIEGKIAKLEGHIGIAVGEDRVLHVEKALIHSACPLRKHPTIRHRIMATFRHEALVR